MLLKLLLQAISIVFFSVILVTQNFDLLLLAFALIVLLFILVGYEELKAKKNLGNRLTMLRYIKKALLSQGGSSKTNIIFNLLL